MGIKNKKKIIITCRKEDSLKVEETLKSSKNVISVKQLEGEKIFKHRLLYVPVFILFFLSTFLTINIFAEQIGSSPESGTDSKFTQLYDDLVTLGIGTEGSGDWGDWGAKWNRIVSGAQRITPPYSIQALLRVDNNIQTNWGETSTWTQTSTIAGSEVWKDDVTGLYWSINRGSMTNSFTRATCQYFSTVPRGNYTGTDSTCGDAINICANLEMATHTNGESRDTWYLPTQKELLQALINGIYKKTNVGWVTTSSFWSSTESQSNASSAISSSLVLGTWETSKTGSVFVRCVIRDL